MPLITYQRIAFKPESMAIIRQAQTIAEDYAAQGYNLTLRQFYYQFVSRDLLPNTQQSYKRLGSIINDARLSGYLDWDRLVDRTRNVEEPNTWASPASIIKGAAQGYDIDLWEGQDLRIEVWVEKEALADVIGRAADSWQVPYFSCRGYVSQSEMWAAGQRLGAHVRSGQRVLLIHLGDHDPSGIDMTRDITDRLTRFIWGDLAEDLGYCDAHEVEIDDGGFCDWTLEEQVRSEHLNNSAEDEPVFAVKRIALNMDQVRQYGPPPNPAKITDSRAVSYINRFGRESWELDALDPATLDRLIRDEVGEHVDLGAYTARQETRDTEKVLLQNTSDRWSDVVGFLGGEAS